MKPRFSIFLAGRLPGLNEVTAANRRNRYAGAKQKAATEDALVIQLHGAPHLYPGHHWRFTWYEADRRRDPDNIASAAKFIFDALQTAGVIANDNWQNVRGIEHRFIAETPVGVLVEAFITPDQAALMPCGHPRAAVVTSAEGTSYCAECEREARG